MSYNLQNQKRNKQEYLIDISNGKKSLRPKEIKVWVLLRRQDRVEPGDIFSNFSEFVFQPRQGVF